MADAPPNRPIVPAPAQSGRPARLTASDRRAQLIQNALRLFSTRGFAGTTTKAIAEASGVSEAIIFRHFATKQDLYDAILQQQAADDGFSRTRAALAKCADRDDDEGLVFQLSLAILESYRRDPAFQRLMLYASLEEHDLAKASQRMLGLPMFDFLAEYVARRQAIGAIREGDARLLVFGLIALPVYYAMVTRLFRVDLVKKPDKIVAREVTSLILDGLRRRPRRRARRSAAPPATDERVTGAPRPVLHEGKK